jgi:glycerol-3-phosphate dehydrogenase subunit B
VTQPDQRTADVVVVGAGLAGLTAAVRLAEAGLRVVTVAKGLGSIRLSPATIDILGYRPDLVHEPARELQGFVSAHPGHPYSLVSPVQLAASVQWLKEHADGYVGDPDANMLLPTALGVPRPSAVVPETMAGGDIRQSRSVAIAGFSVLKDFQPTLAAENLQAAATALGFPLTVRALHLSTSVNGEADVSSLALARRLEDTAFRNAVAAELTAGLRDEEAVGLPAVLGLDQARTVWSDLQAMVGRPVFEIPTVPPSAPGMRLAKVLQDRLRRAGGRLVLGSEAVGTEVHGEQLAGVRVKIAARQLAWMCRWVVLATGGFASGGITVDLSGAASETAFGLPVSVPPPDEPLFLTRYLDEHPMGTAGLRVDPLLRPLGHDGEPAYPNLYAAGAVIGGARPAREKSGDGISLSTGYLAAGIILQEAR